MTVIASVNVIVELIKFIVSSKATKFLKTYPFHIVGIRRERMGYL